MWKGLLRREGKRGQAGLGIRSFQKNATFSGSFAFFSKERNVLAFFCILYKRMQKGTWQGGKNGIRGVVRTERERECDKEERTG